MIYPNYSKSISHVIFGEALNQVKHVEYCYVLTDDANYNQHPDRNVVTADFVFVSKESIKRYDIYWLKQYYRITYVRDLI